ncbi:MAG: hypothetical protein AAGC55_22870, partial [Myxococcota bacterium]
MEFSPVPGQAQRGTAVHLRALLRDKIKIFGVSLALHAAVALVLATLAARQLIEPPAPEPVEIEIIAAPPQPAAEVPPQPELQPELELEPEPIPAQPRPQVVPERAEVKKVERARPFQAEPTTPPGAREAPEDVEAVPAPTAPVVEVAMDSMVGLGDSEFVTTSSDRGSVPVRAGPGGGAGGGPGRG